MIKSLALTNFKSIGKTLILNDDVEPTEGKLEFAPLTIFCGKNSSGKSTVLQSILLLTQTLQGDMHSQTLVLNGPMVKFGSMDDIKSDFTNPNDLDIALDIDIDVNKEIDKIVDFSPLEENVKRVFIDSKSQYYYISNSIDDIKNMLEENMNDRILDLEKKLKNENWELNANLDDGIKNTMIKYNVDFSARVWRGIDNYLIKVEVHKRIKENWYSVYFDENKFIFDKRKNYTDSQENIEIRNNLIQKLYISFSSKLNYEKSKIVPIINCVNIDFPNFCYFKASHRDQQEDIIINYNDFEYCNFEFDDKNRNIIWGIKDLKGIKLKNFLPSEFIYLTSKADLQAFNIIGNCVYKYLENGYQFNDQSFIEYNKNIKYFLSNKEYNFGISDMEINDIIKRVNIDVNIDFDIEFYTTYAKKIISIFEEMNISEKLSKSIFLSYKEHNKKYNSLLDTNYKYTHKVGATDIEGTLKIAVDIIKNYFCNIKYIGPLREEPHLQYNSYSGNNENIGVKGENCAAVLYHNERKIIKYLQPNNISNYSKMVNSYLIDAVNEWLYYIDIAKSVYASFNGRYGYELKIDSIGKNIKNDLTNVGVGVSQILPIVLTCLLAPENSVIIIEQPELHLHPAMQSKLTDFFIATMLSNKQLIIETHSEYIINKIRLYSVKDSIKNLIKDKIQIYFTENIKNDILEFKKGNTLFKPLNINEYAAMSDWPDGFFDESSKIADEIINEVSKKWNENTEGDNE